MRYKVRAAFSCYIFQMCVHRYKTIARFGMMHMVATNLCVWTQNIVQETLREIRHLHQPDRGSNESSDKEISKWRQTTVAINSTHLFIAKPA